MSPGAQPPAASHRIAVPVTVVWSEPRAPRPDDHLAVAPVPDYPAWVSSLDLPARRGLLGRVLTHGLFDEPVRVIDERAGYGAVVLPEQPSSLDAQGYPGWVPLSHLVAEAGRTGALAGAVASFPSGVLETAAGPVSLSYGTWLRTRGGRRAPDRILLPGGGEGRCEEPLDTPRQGGQLVVTEAERFLGLDYLWGGLSGYGVDCSGLVALVYRRLGIAVPRDAHDQASSGTALAAEEARPGDLVLFARPGEPVHHVGIVRGEGEMVHAPRTGCRVEIARFDEKPWLDEERLFRRYAGA